MPRKQESTLVDLVPTKCKSGQSFARTRMAGGIDGQQAAAEMHDYCSQGCPMPQQCEAGQFLTSGPRPEEPIQERNGTITTRLIQTQSEVVGLYGSANGLFSS